MERAGVEALHAPRCILSSFLQFEDAPLGEQHSAALLSPHPSAAPSSLGLCSTHRGRLKLRHTPALPLCLHYQMPLCLSIFPVLPLVNNGGVQVKRQVNVDSLVVRCKLRWDRCPRLGTFPRIYPSRKSPLDEYVVVRIKSFVSLAIPARRQRGVRLLCVRKVVRFTFWRRLGWQDVVIWRSAASATAQRVLASL